MELNGGFKKLARRDPRWLTSFADLMSLLFAMFVMLLSFSEIDSTSFRKNAGPISQAFSDVPVERKAKTPTEQTPGGGQSILEFIRPPEEVEEPEDLERLEKARQIREMIHQLRDILASELQREEVDLIETDTTVTIRFRDRAAFATGDRELTAGIMPALDSIAAVLARTPGRIRVEGHTDNIPISTGIFRSNWDLSAARAASVVHHLLKAGAIEAGRISAEGFADSRPLSPNDTPEGRAMNRRVEISIEMQAAERLKWGGGKPD